MAFGGEIDHARRRMFREYFFKRIAIADINLMETIVRRFCDGDVFWISRIREEVNVDEQGFRVAGNEEIEIVASDEARAARYQNALVIFFHSACDVCPACIRT